MDVPAQTIGVVVQSVRDDIGIEATYRSLQYHSASQSLHIILWCIDCSDKYADFINKSTNVSVVRSKRTFLSSLETSLDLIAKLKQIIICKSGVVFRANCISAIFQKRFIYGEEVPLSVIGIRLFPHEQLQAGEALREGVQWKAYDHRREDRAVHILTTDVCLFNVNTLKQIATLNTDIPSDGLFEDAWISFLIGYYLNTTVWKIKSEGLDCLPSTYRNPICQALYDKICKLNWPKNISNPYYRLPKAATIDSKVIPECLWEHGFGGINMSIEPASEIDFKAAVAYGVKVIRVGAVCDAKDLNFLLDPASRDELGDKHHILLVAPRLKKAIKMASSNGLKVILTMSDLPGCPFYSSTNSSFWSSSYQRLRAAQFWGVLAECLVDIKDSIMGYDLINEPFTPEDQKAAYFDENIICAYKTELQHFYKTALQEIRKYDKDTMVIVKSTYFASPKAIDMLTPLPDPNVAYSVHVYGPPQLTRPRSFPCFKYLSLSYPGAVPKWRNYIEDKVFIDFNFLHSQMEIVYKWQVENSIPANRILIGEFGISREVPGGQQFLTDLVSIFTKFKWSWLIFSFRDEEWDAMDYELGPNMSNMLNRSADPLFLCIAEQFH